MAGGFLHKLCCLIALVGMFPGSHCHTMVWANERCPSHVNDLRPPRHLCSAFDIG